MKTILCAEYQKELIYHALSQKNSQNFVADIRLMTLPNMIISEEENSAQIVMQCMKQLKENYSSFPIYHQMFDYYAFILEILGFARELALWNISANSLPERNPSEIEIKHMLRLVLSLDLKEKSINENLELSIKQIQNIEHLEQTLQFETNYFYKVQKEKLFLPFWNNTVNTKPKKHLYYALNTSQEIEAIAQDICSHQKPCNIILTNEQMQLPVLQQIFNRYHIPFSCIDEPIPTHIQHVYTALLEVALEKTPSRFIDALKKDAFSKSIDKKLIPYLEQCMTSLKVPTPISDQLNLALKNDRNTYMHYEEEAQQYFLDIEEELEKLSHCNNYADMLVAAYEIMQQSQFLKNEDDLKLAFEIRQTIQSVYHYIHTESDVRFIISMIATKAIHKQQIESDYCIVTNLTKPVFTKTISYVVGCSSQNYPAFNAKKGLFDEDYVKAIKEYPEISKRHHAYMEQLKWIEQSASENLIYSYATNDYQGKEIQLAYQIEQLGEKDWAKKWPLIKANMQTVRIHSLQADTAEKLFLKNNAIYGSVSTIERWFQCPYSYFIQSGLRIRAPRTTCADSASLGSMRHYVLEQLVRKYGKEYAGTPKEEIKLLLDDYFIEMKKAYPKQLEQLNLLQTAILENLETNLTFLKDYEANTSFIPMEVEYQFTEEIVPNVILHGVVDRIDTVYQMIRVIDYKSSDKELSQTNVLSGIQLQLLTYLIIAHQIFQKEPAGAYYYSLKNSVISLEAAHVSRNKVIENDKIADQEKYLENQRLTGWKMIDHSTELDQSGTHMKGLTKTYNFPVIQMCIEQLYLHFKNELLKGNITVNPVKGACSYCDYQNICRFHGDGRNPSPILDEELLQKKSGKGEQNDEL